MVTSTSVTLTWDPPFSLDLTTAEPDIQYCVDVHSVPGRQLVESTCDIIDTNYTFSTSNQDQLVFTVTPRSNVEGSLNGTSNELVGPPSQGKWSACVPSIIYYSYVVPLSSQLTTRLLTSHHRHLFLSLFNHPLFIQ